MAELERIKIVIQWLIRMGIAPNQGAIGQLMGYKNKSAFSQILNGHVPIPKKFIESLASLHDEININFLVSGYGEPIRQIKGTKQLNLVNEPVMVYAHGGVPYYEDLDVTASVITSFQDYKEVPTFLINYKHFNDCDAYLPVVGDSMYPKYSSGEIVAIKQIQSIETILWGETYLVITNENANSLRTIKDVHYCKDETKLILRACNPDYAGDTYINKTDIVSMFIVKGRIRRNQL